MEIKNGNHQEQYEEGRKLLGLKPNHYKMFDSNLLSLKVKSE